MKLTYINPIHHVSGKLPNQTVAWADPAGRNIGRAWVRPSNFMTAARYQARAFMQFIAGEFRNLTPAQWERWDEYGRAEKRRDSLGREYGLTAQQAFQAVNCDRFHLGFDVSLDAPERIEANPTIQTTGIWTYTPPDILQGRVAHTSDVYPIIARARVSIRYDSPHRRARLNEYRFGSLETSERFRILYRNQSGTVTIRVPTIDSLANGWAWLEIVWFTMETHRIKREEFQIQID